MSVQAAQQTAVDGLNHVEYPLENYQPTYFDQHIVEIAFLHNLVLVRKGNNTEPTNIPVLVTREVRAALNAAALTAARPDSQTAFADAGRPA